MTGGEIVIRKEEELVFYRQVEEAKALIIGAKSLAEAKANADKVAVFEEYLKRKGASLDLQLEVNELVRIAERALGEFTATLEKAKPGVKAKTELCSRPEHNSKTATLAEAGITRKASSEAERTAKIDGDVFNSLKEVERKTGEPISKAELLKLGGLEAAAQREVISKATAEAKSVGDVISKLKDERYNAEIREQAAREAAKPDGFYSCIIIDPPWPYGTEYNSKGRRCGNPYPEMKLEDIAALDIRAKPDSILFLWTTDRFLWEARPLLEGWGFEYKATLVWDKMDMGMGSLFRLQTEYCLVGVKGRPPVIRKRDTRNLITEKSREHSRKPEAFYSLVNEICPGSKLEYFARTRRPGYDVFGNDTNHFTANWTEDGYLKWPRRDVVPDWAKVLSDKEFEEMTREAEARASVSAYSDDDLPF